jgi:hypothetical protein
MTPVDEELRSFDMYISHARGLAPSTCRQRLRVIARLLLDKFTNNTVIISAMNPDDVRKFVAKQSELCSTSVIASPLYPKSLEIQLGDKGAKTH